jgi:aminoglycoside phosphotransferase (APT) family kinase protein
MPMRIEDLIDAPRLTAWLDAHLPALGSGPLELKRLRGAGASNEIIELKRGGAPVILRRPPNPPREASNKIMLREFRVLSALEGTPVPHAKPLAVCDDAGVVGANFYVMEKVDGFTPMDPLPEPFVSDPSTRRGLGYELIDALAALANVDYRAIGLDDFGKPDGFLARQVERWLGQLDSYRGTPGYEARELPGLDAVAAWLTANTPPMSAPGILHGDYQFINVMFRPGAPAKLAAIVDWEQATIGDPLLDLGWVLSGWSDPGEPPARGSYIAERAGHATRQELAERYAAATGRSIAHLDYYVVLAKFKLAALLEGHYARACAGKGDKQMGDIMGGLSLGLIEDAAAIVAR